MDRRSDGATCDIASNYVQTGRSGNFADIVGICCCFVFTKKGNGPPPYEKVARHFSDQTKFKLSNVNTTVYLTLLDRSICPIAPKMKKKKLLEDVTPPAKGHFVFRV